MKLQTATLLGLYAVLELADQPGQQLSRLEIARKFGVSSNHLSKVMRELCKAGMVNSVRGAGGGYQFIANAKRTTLIDVIRLFEPFNIDSGDQQVASIETDLGKTLNLVLDEINETIHATLNSITIATMLTLKTRFRHVDNASLPAQEDEAE